MNEHRFITPIDWAEVRQRVSDSTMRSLGIRPIRFATNVVVRGDDGAEWECACAGCGRSIRYVTRGRDPDLRHTHCSDCKEGQ